MLCSTLHHVSFLDEAGNFRLTTRDVIWRNGISNGHQVRVIKKLAEINGNNGGNVIHTDWHLV